MLVRFPITVTNKMSALAFLGLSGVENFQSDHSRRELRGGVEGSSSTSFYDILLLVDQRPANSGLCTVGHSSGAAILCTELAYRFT